MPDRYAHCTFCGARFVAGRPWPRRCGACGETSYLNPKPVAVVLQPVGAGLLVVRRGIAPGKGLLALPGGYVDVGETWQAAATRELGEETGLKADPAAVRLYDTISTDDGNLLIFGILPPIESMTPFVPNEETLGVQILAAPEPLAFDLHTLMADRWFAKA